MVRDRPDGGLVARYRFVFGRFRTRLRGFLFRGFSGTFLVAPSQDAIYVKRRPRLFRVPCLSWFGLPTLSIIGPRLQCVLLKTQLLNVITLAPDMKALTVFTIPRMGPPADSLGSPR